MSVLIHIDHDVVRTGVAEQSAKLERRRAEKRLANTARRETGCKIDWDFRSVQTLGQPSVTDCHNRLCGVTLAASPPHPTPHMFGGAGTSEQHQTPLCGPARDRRPAGPPSESVPLLAARGDFGVLKCECVDACRMSRCTYGFCRAVCEIRAPTSGEKVS